MKVRSYGLVIVSLAILLGSCFTAAATSITDGTGDVWHWYYTGTTGSWGGNVANKPNIDIKEISYEVNDGKITLKMEVTGSIQTSDKIGYYLWYNSTDTVYMMTYMNGQGGGTGVKGGNYMNGTYTQNVTISGDTLSTVLDVLGDTSQVELWGMAVEYTTFGDISAEYWGDWAPNTKLPFTPPVTDGTDGTDGTNGTDGNQNNNQSGSGTPGFELVFVVAAVAVTMILLRKRR